ncbi:hypothetical protein AUJ84_02290 [Candidatus Pacearchaeota archaeon CG1_02_32_132]|nr:MAG: hypothetical protein AUJ84_02290 [Candidatus Pacearchaeota archaeon CG1_02_32_132]
MILNYGPKTIFLILIALAVVLEVTGDIYFKKYSIENKNVLLFIGLIVYFLGSIFWAISLKYELLSKSITLFTILNLIIVLAVGVLIFNEQISDINKIGIVLGIISVALMEI